MAHLQHVEKQPPRDPPSVGRLPCRRGNTTWSLHASLCTCDREKNVDNPMGQLVGPALRGFDAVPKSTAFSIQTPSHVSKRSRTKTPSISIIYCAVLAFMILLLASPLSSHCAPSPPASRAHSVVCSILAPLSSQPLRRRGPEAQIVARGM